MGSFHMEIPSSLFEFLNKLEGNIDVICCDGIKASEPIIEKALKEECAKHNIAERDTTRGAMVASIKATGPKKTKSGIYDFVRPTGKDAKGVRNMEKLAYLEYGTSKQPATPVCTKVKNQISKEVADTMENEIKKGMGL